MTERTTIRLPEDLLARARKKAASEGRTLTSLIEEGLTQVLSGERRPRKPFKPLPVCTATGGLQPGVDLNRMSDIYEQEDEAGIERIRRGFQE